MKASTQTLVPAIVAPARLERANGRMNATLAGTRDSLGPVLGSALFALATPLPFWVDVLTFAASALLMARISKSTADGTARTQRGPLRADIVEGLRWLARHRLVRTLTFLTAVANLCNTMALARSSSSPPAGCT